MTDVKAYLKRVKLYDAHFAGGAVVMGTMEGDAG